MWCSIYSTRLVRDSRVQYLGRQANSTTKAIEIAIRLLHDAPNEQMLNIMLDTKLRVIGACVVSVGLLEACLVQPREFYRPAILANASRCIMAHNHPSGVLKPSQQDLSVTERIRDAGRILQIELADSIIVSHKKGLSLAEEGLMGD